ncbi:MAG: hypothetical protein KatS3mg110_3168 [Pirellulaceae bacterium]|nr:MAG: hypothetical protein KatS3mg110_3168 [Pirellulaceae bacterium]
MQWPQKVYVVLCAVAVFLSAFLLFLVQPLISKAILPWFGGTPAVWTTCMLFFQTGLLVGYFYADRLVHLEPRWQRPIHILLLAAAIALLPIVPSDAWKPADGRWPALRILLVLSVSVGLPYLVLSTTGPLLQAWFAATLPGRSPYRLYALSNAGSLLALVAYPLVLERWLEVPAQGWLWSAGFVLFAVCCAAVAWWSRWQSVGDEESGQLPGYPPQWRDWAAWLSLPMIAVIALLAVTQHVCRDIAVVPFLWVVPLALYLLSFIICFDRERWYAGRFWSLLVLGGSLLVMNVMLAKFLDQFFQEIGWTWEPSKVLRRVYIEAPIYFAWLFLACMLCHGELVRRKPAPKYLTRFYLALAAGGAAGGCLSALVFPYVFANYWELYLVLGAVLGLSLWVLYRDGWEPWFSRSWALCGAFFVIAATAAFLWSWTFGETFDNTVVTRVRNFYGMLTVREWYENEPQKHGFALYNGHILHGYQFADPQRRRLPTTYYDEGSGPQIVMQWLRKHHSPLRIGVIGLGTGTLAAYAEEGDYICFYEINPDVIKVQNEYFTYLKDCPAEKHIELGDARVQMERQEPQQFDVLFVDAFSGDAIPAHLMTREALAVYRRHMKPDGLVMFHISNRYLDLLPVVMGLAQDAGLSAVRFLDSEYGDVFSSSSDWVAVTASRNFTEDPEIVERQTAAVVDRLIVWTDHYSNLFEVLH